MVAAPAVEVPVRAYGQRVAVACLDLAESDVLPCRRRNSGLGIAGFGPVIRADAPGFRAFGPLGGEGEIVGDRLVEVVGDRGVADEPSVEEVAVLGRVGWPYCALAICDCLGCIGA